MKKIVFTIALLVILSAICSASTSVGGPGYKQQSGHSFVKSHKNVHHSIAPLDHYSI